MAAFFFEHDFSWNKTIAVCHVFYMCMFCSSIFVHTLSIPYLFSMSVFWFFSSPYLYPIYTLSILHVRFLVSFFSLSIPYLYPIYTPCSFSGIFLLPIYTLSILQVRFLVFFFTLSIPYLYPIYTPGSFSGIFLHPIYTLSKPYLYPIYIYIFIALKSHSSRICSSNVWPYIYYNSFSFFETAHFI